MIFDRRLLLVGGGGVLLGAAAMALMSARQNPGPGVTARDPVADPFIPAAPGGPNAIGQLAVEGGGEPRVPRVETAANAPRRLVVPFAVGPGVATPAEGWTCVHAVGAWAVGQIDAGRTETDASADPAVAAACGGSGSGPATGKLRLATRSVPGATAGELTQRCEVTLKYQYAGPGGVEARPELRSEASAAESPCADALAGLEAEFRARVATAP